MNKFIAPDRKPSDYPCLVSSISHWIENDALYQRNAELDLTAASCACCCEVMKYSEGRLHCSVQYLNGNFVCPIFAYTQLFSCTGTPYDAVNNGSAAPADMLGWLKSLYADGAPPLVDAHNNPLDDVTIEQLRNEDLSL